jgi:hypothetical protein
LLPLRSSLPFDLHFETRSHRFELSFLVRIGSASRGSIFESKVTHFHRSDIPAYDVPLIESALAVR